MGLDNPVHLAILLMILLLVFGAKRLPEMGRSLGSGLRGFKEAVTGDVTASEITAQPTQQAPAVLVAPAAVVVPAPVIEPTTERETVHTAV